jgi:hypothetical protein
LTIFKLHFGKLTLKAYTKGEHVLRFEAIVHNTKDLRCGRVLDRFPAIVVRLRQILEQFLGNVYCMDAAFISDESLDRLPKPSQLGRTRVGGVDVNKPRMRAGLSAALSLACSPNGFTVNQFSTAVGAILGPAEPDYGARRAAYDLKKLRGKELVRTVARSRRYYVPPEAIRQIAALVIIRDKILRPLLAGVSHSETGWKPSNWSPIDERYHAVRQNMLALFQHLRIAA